MTNTSAPQDSSNQSGRFTVDVDMVFFWLIIIFGVVGNSLVITVVKMIRSMRTATNYLLVNVAAADVTTLVFTAIHFLIRIIHPTSPKALLSFLCAFIYNNTIVIVTLLVTSLTMTLLAFERYHALVKPLINSGRLTNGNIAYVIAAIWVVAIAMVTPLFAGFSYDSTAGTCHADLEELAIYVSCLFIVLTFIPFIIIAYCYSQIVYGLYVKKTICSNKSERAETPEEAREKRRLVILLILLSVVFFTAFVPYGLLIILNFNRMKIAYLTGLRHVAQYLTLLSCSVNPFIYAFQSSSYRHSFNFLFKRLFRRDTTVNSLELIKMRTGTSSRTV